MAEQTENVGLCCPKCHCRNLIAVYSKRYGARMMRARRCRHCGHVVHTSEQIINTDPKRRAA